MVLLLILGAAATVYMIWSRTTYLSLVHLFVLYIGFVSIRLAQSVASPAEAPFEVQQPLWVLSVVCLAALTCRGTYLYTYAMNRAPRLHARDSLSDSLKLMAGIVCITLGCMAYVAAIRSTGVSLATVYLLTGSGLRYLRDLPLYLDLGMHLGTAGVCLLALRIRDLRGLLGAYLWAAPLFMLASTLGRRSLLVPILMIPLLIYVTRSRQMSSRLILWVVGLGLVGSMTLMTARYYYGYGYFRNDGGLAPAATLALNSHVKEADPLVYALDNYSMWGGTEWVASSWWEWTYALIPRAVIPDKPTRRSVDKKVAQHFFGSRDARHGTPATILGTLYLGAGIPLLMIGAAVLGVCFAYVDRLGTRVARDGPALAYVTLWLFFAIFFFRLGDLTTALIQSVVQLSPAWAVYALLHLMQAAGRTARAHPSTTLTNP